MKFKFEKNVVIISELIKYFHSIGVNDIHIDMGTDEITSYFHISGKILNLSKDKLENLSLTLNIPRQHEVEQHYWSLGGETDCDCELCLIGIMIDEVDISYVDNILTLKIVRKETDVY